MDFSKFLPKYNRDSFEKSQLATLSRWQLITAIAGFGISVFAVVLHVKLKTALGEPLICDINDTINCSKIIGSSFGELFGISLGAYGMAFFGIAFGVTILPLVTKASKAYVAFWRFFVALVGMIVALIAAFISYVVLEGVCEVCSAIQVACLVYFVLALRELLTSKGGLMFSEKNSFWRLALATTGFFSMPLLLAATTSHWYTSQYQTKAEPMPLLATVTEDIARFRSGQNAETPDYRKGSDSAPLVLVEFTDFECPFCQKLHQRLEEVQSEIGKDNLLVVFRHWSLAYNQHSKKLAIAARCAGRQDKFWPMADWIFATNLRHSSDKEKKSTLFSLEALVEQAVKLGVTDRGAFATCLKNREEESRVNEDIKEAEALGGKGTPFIIINGSPYNGNWLKKGELEADLKSMLTRLKSARKLH